MNRTMVESANLNIAGTDIALGQRCDIELPVSESYSGSRVLLPMHVWRAQKPGPTVAITAAVHGDELNGTGIVRSLMLNPAFDLTRGSLVLVPVVNVLGFENRMRYLPDRRDLNRSFPGYADGSLASRFAHIIFSKVLANCDYGIDLHTAAVRRTNFPNIRADMARQGVARIAKAFGCEIIINSKGPEGSIRRASCSAGRPTIILEAGEVWKIEPTLVEYGVRGIRNILIDLDMVQGQPKRPPYQVRIDRTKWLRANVGGILQFHVAPGDIVDGGQAIATSANLLGKDLEFIVAPRPGIVLGLTTLPAVTPGNPICHLALPKEGVDSIRKAQDKAPNQGLHERVRDDLATSVFVSEPEDVANRHGSAGRRR